MQKLQVTKIYNILDAAYRDKQCRLISLQGGTRSGKTYNTIAWLIVHSLIHPNTTIDIIRKTRPSLVATVLKDFKVWMQDYFELWDDKMFNKTELVYKMPNGSVFEFYSLDNEAKIRGRKRRVLFINEATELSLYEYEQADLRTEDFTILDYNPSFSDEHWISDVNKEDSTIHAITTYLDNPFLPERVIDKIKSLKSKNNSLWRIYGLGLQGAVEGLIFEHFKQVKEMPMSCKRRRIGIDYGYSSDPTAIVDVGIDGDNLYLQEVCYKTHMLTGEIIKELKQLGRLRVFSETEPRMIDEIHNAGVDIHPVRKTTIKLGIMHMQQYNIFVVGDSPNLIKELRNYVYKQDKNGKVLSDPIDEYNHLMDASRYAITDLIGGKKRTNSRVKKLQLD